MSCFTTMPHPAAADEILNTTACSACSTSESQMDEWKELPKEAEKLPSEGANSTWAAADFLLQSSTIESESCLKVSSSGSTNEAQQCGSAEDGPTSVPSPESKQAVLDAQAFRCAAPDSLDPEKPSEGPGDAPPGGAQKESQHFQRSAILAEPGRADAAMRLEAERSSEILDEKAGSDKVRPTEDSGGEARLDLAQSGVVPASAAFRALAGSWHPMGSGTAWVGSEIGSPLRTESGPGMLCCAASMGGAVPSSRIESSHQGAGQLPNLVYGPVQFGLPPACHSPTSIFSPAFASPTSNSQSAPLHNLVACSMLSESRMLSPTVELQAGGAAHLNFMSPVYHSSVGGVPNADLTNGAGNESRTLFAYNLGKSNTASENAQWAHQMQQLEQCVSSSPNTVLGQQHQVMGDRVSVFASPRAAHTGQTATYLLSPTLPPQYVFPGTVSPGFHPAAAVRCSSPDGSTVSAAERTALPAPVLCTDLDEVFSRYVSLQGLACQQQEQGQKLVGNESGEVAGIMQQMQNRERLDQAAHAELQAVQQKQLQQTQQSRRTEPRLVYPAFPVAGVADPQSYGLYQQQQQQPPQEQSQQQEPQPPQQSQQRGQQERQQQQHYQQQGLDFRWDQAPSLRSVSDDVQVDLLSSSKQQADQQRNIPHLQDPLCSTSPMAQGFASRPTASGVRLQAMQEQKMQQWNRQHPQLDHQQHPNLTAYGETLQFASPTSLVQSQLSAGSEAALLQNGIAGTSGNSNITSNVSNGSGNSNNSGRGRQGKRNTIVYEDLDPALLGAFGKAKESILRGACVAAEVTTEVENVRLNSNSNSNSGGSAKTLLSKLREFAATISEAQMLLADFNLETGKKKEISEFAIGPKMLAHPNEFVNPSSFLKIYGDPLCNIKEASLPKKHMQGNWVCPNCQNVNYPRRFRCHNNRCKVVRDQGGDEIVKNYALRVYQEYLSLYERFKLDYSQVLELALKKNMS